MNEYDMSELERVIEEFSAAIFGLMESLDSLKLEKAAQDEASQEESSPNGSLLGNSVAEKLLARLEKAMDRLIDALDKKDDSQIVKETYSDSNSDVRQISDSSSESVYGASTADASVSSATASSDTVSDQVMTHERSEQMARDSISEMNRISDIAGTMMTAVMSGGAEGMKEVLREQLLTMLDFVQRQIEIGIVAAAARTLLSGGILGLKELAQVAAVKVGFAALKNSVASFDDGGIPVRDGLGMLHRTDVTLNPTSDNPMMTSLLNRLTDAVGSGKNVILNVDGRELGRATIGDISRRNRQLPKGRDVFDESRWNG